MLPSIVVWCKSDFVNWGKWLESKVKLVLYILRNRVKNNEIPINKTDHSKKLIGSKRVFEIHDLKTI